MKLCELLDPVRQIPGKEGDNSVLFQEQQHYVRPTSAAGNWAGRVATNSTFELLSNSAAVLVGLHRPAPELVR